MDHDNGRKRGFGPHGENCECDELTQETPDVEVEEEPQVVPTEPPRMLISLRDNPNDLMELMFVAISDAFAQALSDAILYCGFDDVPLSERQIIRLTGAMMRGLALAKHSATVVQQNYILAAMQSEVQERQEAEPEEPAENEHGTRDVSDLFRQEPTE